jgi:hypothetical protein
MRPAALVQTASPLKLVLSAGETPAQTIGVLEFPFLFNQFKNEVEHTPVRNPSNSCQLVTTKKFCQPEGAKAEAAATAHTTSAERSIVNSKRCQIT